MHLCLEEGICMKEKLKSGKEKFFAGIHTFNEKRNVNTEKFSRLNFWLLIIFPIFISCMAEINQGKYIGLFLIFFAQRSSVMIFNFLVTLVVLGKLI